MVRAGSDQRHPAGAAGADTVPGPVPAAGDGGDTETGAEDQEEEEDEGEDMEELKEERECWGGGGATVFDN